MTRLIIGLLLSSIGAWAACLNMVPNPVTGKMDCTAGSDSVVIPGRISTTGASAAITTANIVGTAAAGLYRVSGYLQTTTAAAGACTSDVTIGWTYNSAAKTEEVVSNHDENTDEQYSQIPPTIVRVEALTDLTYAVSLDAGGGDCSNAVFDVYLVAERIQ